MSYRNILVPVGADRRTDVRLQVTANLARAFNAHVTGTFVHPSAPIGAPWGDPGAPLGAEVLQTQRRAAAERASDARARFEAAMAGVGADWLDEEGDLTEVLSQRARYFDLTVLGQSDAEGAGATARRLPERVVMASGRPVLVIPYAGSFERVGERVLIAWNGTREAARAVHDAMPFLERAHGVIVLEIDPPSGGSEGAAYLAGRLARAGIKAEGHHTVSGGVGHGDILLSSLADMSCDMLVMGAYGHSRVRELVLGGVTRSVLEHMTVPVLMSF